MVKPRLTMNPVIIRFFGRLNDFLPQARRNKRISYLVAGSPAVKDTIEALGVPHVEVGSIRVNKKIAGAETGGGRSTCRSRFPHP